MSKFFPQNLRFSSSLSDIERGKSSARLDKLAAIINALECSADDIFADVINNGYKIKSSRLADSLEKLSEKEQKIAFAILETLLNLTNE